VVAHIALDISAIPAHRACWKNCGNRHDEKTVDP